MNVAGTEGEEGYAIPMADVMAVAEAVLSGQGTDTVTIGRTAGLGVQVSLRATGVLIVDVIADGPAEAAGLSAGSTLTSLDGVTLTSNQDLSEVLAAHQPGEQAEISWVDAAGDSHTATVTFTEAPLA